MNEKMTEEKPPAQTAFGQLAPKFADLTDKVLFGGIWEGSELSKRAMPYYCRCTCGSLSCERAALSF